MPLRGKEIKGKLFQVRHTFLRLTWFCPTILEKNLFRSMSLFFVGVFGYLFHVLVVVVAVKKETLNESTSRRERRSKARYRKVFSNGRLRKKIFLMICNLLSLLALNTLNSNTHTHTTQIGIRIDTVRAEWKTSMGEFPSSAAFFLFFFRKSPGKKPEWERIP